MRIIKGVRMNQYEDEDCNDNDNDNYNDNENDNDNDNDNSTHFLLFLPFFTASFRFFLFNRPSVPGAVL